MEKRPYLNFIVTVLILLLVSFIIIMISQAAQLVGIAANLHPYLGKAVLIFFVILGLASAVYVILLLSKFEKPLEIPDEENSEEYKQYILKLKNRLKKNKFLNKSNYVWDDSRPDIESVNDALLKIDQEAQKIIKGSAGGVFTTTAVSQNGSLDGLFVFVVSMKLIWKISTLYNQRPALRDLLKLYMNVFATVLAARQIDDLDIVAEQLGQILPAAMTGAFGSVVPGVSFITSFVADSILEGTINTLLVLRIGLLTQLYSRSITRPEPKRLSKTATVQACKMLGEIISKDLISIIGVWSKSAFKAVTRVPRSTKDTLMDFFKIKSSDEEAAITDID
jgi:hypothetical protein